MNCKRCNDTRTLIVDRLGGEHPGDSSVKPAGGGSVGECPCTIELDARYTLPYSNKREQKLYPELDPDPLGIHGIPLSIRLQEMGWT